MAQKTALLSVYEKAGITEFAKALVERDWQILASGGTARHLKAAGVPVRDVAEIVGEAILEHRVVTLSREVHAGLLARTLVEDVEELERIGVPRIDLVCVDLYPLEATIATSGSTRADVIEKTDVGGPTLLHSGAKGERIMICDPADRAPVLASIDAGVFDSETTQEGAIDALAAKAEATVARYCLASARYRSGSKIDGMIGTLTQQCKYGENAWQIPAGLYATTKDDPLALHNFKLVEGDAPSYNNLCDIDRMLMTLTHIIAAFHNFRTPMPLAAVGVKHGNACGAAFGKYDGEVITNMIGGDTRAIFGGLVMMSFPIDALTARLLCQAHMSEGRRLLDGVVAPSFTESAIDILARKGGKCRLIANPALLNLNLESLNRASRFRAVRGGFLLQPNYTYVPNLWDDPHVVRHGSITSEQVENLLLASAIGRTSNSNTITLVKNRQLIGNGVGQQDRVGAAELAVKRARDAGHNPDGAVAYSDSFFPFTDGVEVLVDAGIVVILTSSGSIRDNEVIALCQERGVGLVMIPDAEGRGFAWH
jgi:phosphoribosylaminoimidazolecarboxamide formyltransferase/IMP cyclohydrolase